MRLRRPYPPPSVNPPTPVCEMTPVVVARPYCSDSLSSMLSRAPPRTEARRARGSIVTAFICDKSIIRPRSQTDLPGQLWPPPRTAVNSLRSCANVTACLTSSSVRQRAISAGRLSCMPFQTTRAAS